MTNKTNTTIKSYIPMIKFLAEILGPNCEVVLHDTKNYENSIIAIENNYISGRKIGAPLTDLALKVLKDKEYLDVDYVKNYQAKTKDGKILNSFTYFIKDSDGQILGFICINKDVTNLIHTRDTLNELIFGTLTEKLIKENALNKPKVIEDNLNEKNQKNTSNLVTENLSDSLDDLIEDMVQESILKNGVEPERMSPEEKIDIVKMLNEKGLFQIKGIVSKVAEYLQTSEASVYRYLSKVQNKKIKK